MELISLFTEAAASGHPLFWSAPVLLAVAGAWLVTPAVGRLISNLRLNRTLHSLGPEVLEYVVLDDGVDGLAYIDRLVLTPKSIMVVALVENRGAIFGGEGIDTWAQVIGKRTTRFPNPVERNTERMLAVQYNAPDVPVESLVLFPEEAQFPKGKPEGVAVPSDIPKGKPQPDAMFESLRAAWSSLSEAARSNAEAYSNDVAMLRGGRGVGRPLFGSLFLAAALALAVWGTTLML